MRRRRLVHFPAAVVALAVFGVALLLVACTAPTVRTPPTSTPASVPIGNSSPLGASTAIPLPPVPTEAAVDVPRPTPTPIGRLTSDPTAVVVFAASPFGNAFSELGSDFMLAAPDATGVNYRFDNSTQLRSLIQGGADVDVFVSMDPAQMDTLNQANMLDAPPTILVHDRLVVVVSKSNPQGLTAFKDLGNPGVRFIIPAPANTTTAAIASALDRADSDPTYGANFKDRADRNVLSRDGDDRLVIQRIVSGEVSAGIVYASSVDPGSRQQLTMIEIPDNVSPAASYPIAVLKKASNLRGGQAFLKYALSPRAQAVLSRYGFARLDAPENGTP